MPINTMTSLAALPKPPVFDRVLFESPLVAPIVMVAIAIVVAAILVRQNKARWGATVLAAGAASAIAVAIVSRIVETPREQIEARTRELVDAFAKGNRDIVDRLISHRIVLSAAGNDLNSAGDVRSLMLGQIDRVDAAINEHSTRIVSSIADSPMGGRVRFSVRASIAGGGLNFTVWQAEWRRDSDEQWRMYSLEWRKINGQEPSLRKLVGSHTLN